MSVAATVTKLKTIVKRPNSEELERIEAQGLALNWYEVSGVIPQPVKLKRSPAGVNHLLFAIEHRSTQIEADLPRNSYVRMQVVISGEAATQWANELTEGCAVRVGGFLNRHADANGLAKLVLHAQQLQKI